MPPSPAPAPTPPPPPLQPISPDVTPMATMGRSVITPTVAPAPAAAVPAAPAPSLAPAPVQAAAPGLIMPTVVPPVSAAAPVTTATPTAPQPTLTPLTPALLNTAPAAGAMPGMVVSSPLPGAVMPSAGGAAGTRLAFGSKKKKVMMATAAGLLLLIGGGAVFGLYLPSQPDNVWNTGLDRSGKALDTVYSKATEQSRIDAYKKSEVIVKADYKAGANVITGNADFKFDASKSNGSVDFSLKSSDGKPYEGSLNFITNTTADSLIPDIFFQLNGLKSLNADDIIPGISQYEGKWIAADHTYLESLYPADKTSLNSKPNLSSSDYKELAGAAISTTTDYVLTSDSGKAVLSKKSFVGKEDVDGLGSYHFKASINKPHAKDYCKALITNITATGAYKKLPFVDKSNVDKDKTSMIKDCQDSVDSDFKDSDEFDVWIDSKYKLIHKVRMYEANKKDYTDVGQTYAGGDDLTLYIASHSDASKNDTKFELNLNLKNSQTKGTLTSKSGSDDNLTVSLEAKPYSGEIKTDKPAGAVPLSEVLDKLGISDMFGGNNAVNVTEDSTPAESGGTGKDIEKKTDMNSVATQLEIYFNDNEGYPLFAGRLNSDSWITANFKGADLNAFRAPGQTKNSMVNSAKPTSDQYGYIALESDGTTVCKKEPCALFMLYYTDSTGTTKSKASLN